MKKWRGLWIGLLLLPLFLLPVRADAGPKPSVTVVLEGAEGEPCWGTLLTEAQSTGPYSAVEGENLSFPDHTSAEERETWKQFSQLALESGGVEHFLGYVDDCSDGVFRWTYYPPQTFRLALWFPERDALVVSGAGERYAFDSYFTVDLAELPLEDGAVETAEGGIALRPDYRLDREVGGALFRLLLTLGAELILALAFGLRERRQLKMVVLVNLVTQGLLNLGLELFTYFVSPLAGMMAILTLPVYLVLELLIVWIELTVYRRALVRPEGPSRRRLLAYTWVANMASLLLGVALSFQLPALF